MRYIEGNLITDQRDGGPLIPFPGFVLTSQLQHQATSSLEQDHFWSLKAKNLGCLPGSTQYGLAEKMSKNTIPLNLPLRPTSFFSYLFEGQLNQRFSIMIRTRHLHQICISISMWLCLGNGLIFLDFHKLTQCWKTIQILKYSKTKWSPAVLLIS